MENAGNLGKKMKIKGTLMHQYGIGGIGNIIGDADSFWIEGMDEPGGGDEPVQSGDGTEANPYSCAQATDINLLCSHHPPQPAKCAKGYI